MIINKAQVEQAVAILGLEGIALDKAAVTAAFRNIAKTAHPDVGGDPEQWAAADRAKCLLMAYLDKEPSLEPSFQRPDCTSCGGRGRISIRRGFGVLTIQCGRCKGSGDAQWEEDIKDT